MAESLQAFLAENAIKAESVDYVASKRFVDTNRTPIAWKITPISSEKNEAISDRCKRKHFIPGTKQTEVELDTMEYAKELICTCVTFPNLNDAALQSSYGAVGAADLIRKMLTPGEFTDLFSAVQQANNFEAGMAEKIKAAKN